MEVEQLSVGSEQISRNANISSGFTVIIPAYNEEDRIGPLLEDLSDFIDSSSAPWKVIVVIDGDDETSSIVQTYSHNYNFIKYIQSSARCGKGGAVKRAVNFVETEFVILMDADNSVLLNSILKNAHLLRDNDMVILSRYENKMNTIPAFRRFISRGFNMLLRVILGIKVHDTQSGYKLIRTSAFKDAMEKITTTDAFFDVAMLYYMNRSNYNILEVPVSYEHNNGSTFHPIGLMIGLGVSLIAFRIRQTKLFDFVPRSLVKLYYRKFKWL